MDVATIITSASVAAFITLAIEYAAKPRLEARKERLLEHQRVRRETIAALAIGHMGGTEFDSLRRQDAEIQRADLNVARLAEVRASLAEQAHVLRRNVGLLASVDDLLLIDFILTAAIWFTICSAREAVPSEAEMEILDGLVGRGQDLLRTSPRSRRGKYLRRHHRSWYEAEAAPWLRSD